MSAPYYELPPKCAQIYDTCGDDSTHETQHQFQVIAELRDIMLNNNNTMTARHAARRALNAFEALL